MTRRNLGRKPQVKGPKNREPVKRATAISQPLSPASRAWNSIARRTLGLTPQALCSRLLRRLIA